MPESRPTILDVASAAGVSRQTVSNALNAPDRLAPTTLERVLAAIHEIGYHPSPIARALRGHGEVGVALEIGALGCLALEGLAAELLPELTRAADAKEARVVPLLRHPEDQREAYAALARSGHASVVVLPALAADDPRPGWLREHGLTCVSVGRPEAAGMSAAWAEIDPSAGLDALVGHVVQAGYAGLGLLLDAGDVGAWAWYNPSRLLTAWAAAVERHGIADRCRVLDLGGQRRLGVREPVPAPGMSLFSDTTTPVEGREDAPPRPPADPGERDEKEAIGVLLAGLPPDTALICVGARLASALVRAVAGAPREAGRIGVAVIDAPVLARVLDLTALSVPVEEMASHLAGTAIDLALGRAPDEPGRTFGLRLQLGSTTAQVPR